MKVLTEQKKQVRFTPCRRPAKHMAQDTYVHPWVLYLIFWMWLFNWIQLNWAWLRLVGFDRPEWRRRECSRSPGGRVKMKGRWTKLWKSSIACCSLNGDNDNFQGFIDFDLPQDWYIVYTLSISTKAIIYQHRGCLSRVLISLNSKNVRISQLELGAFCQTIIEINWYCIKSWCLGFIPMPHMPLEWQLIHILWLEWCLLNHLKKGWA